MSLRHKHIARVSLLITIVLISGTCTNFEEQLGDLFSGLKERGGGIFASQSVGAFGVVQLHLLSGYENGVPQLTALPAGSVAPRPGRQYYELRLSPDDWSDHVLAFTAGEDIEDARVKIFRTRDGSRAFEIAASLESFAQESWDLHTHRQFDPPLVNNHLVDAYWVAPDEIVLRFRFLAMGVQQDDMLTRIEWQDFRDGPSVVAAEVKLVERFTGRGTGAFAKRTNPRQADDHIGLNESREFLIDGQPTSGGPSGVRRYDGVLYY